MTFVEEKSTFVEEIWLFVENIHIFVSRRLGMEILESQKAIVEKFDDSIVLIEFKQADSIGANDLENIEEAVGKLIGNHPYFSITVLPQSFKNFSDEAKHFVTADSKKMTNRIFDCYVAGNLAKRLELEVFFQRHKPARKTRVFNSLNKALTFLEGQKKLEIDKVGILV